jgi:UDP-N-acetylglucosamine 2-epimerase (non-hydrolysing)
MSRNKLPALKKRIMFVAGARPNFVKIAPLLREFSNHRDLFETFLVHTGQHYDFDMSGVFFQGLQIPDPDIHLNVGSHSHAVQTARIMITFEKVVIKNKPDLVVIVGDVNSTLACALVASKLCVKVAHVEAGLRSFDRTMPEEINRVVTDSISDYLFVSEESGLRNLKREGVSSEKVHFVGNVMIDSLIWAAPFIKRSNILDRLNLTEKGYGVVTLHRPSNVDSKESLSAIYDILRLVSEKIELIYPVHPRAQDMLKRYGLLEKLTALANLRLTIPLGYLDFVRLMKTSRFVLTDSGGIQEETTALGIPCLTMRGNTERPVTVKQGTNTLVGKDMPRIVRGVTNVLSGKFKRSIVPALWDGMASGRIAAVIQDQLVDHPVVASVLGMV